MLGEGGDEILAHEHAHEGALFVEDGKVVLGTGTNKLDRIGQRILRRERVKLGCHRPADRNARQGRLDLHHARLLCSADPDKEGCGNQRRVGKETDESQKEGQGYPGNITERNCDPFKIHKYFQVVGDFNPADS